MSVSTWRGHKVERVPRISTVACCERRRHSYKTNENHGRYIPRGSVSHMSSSSHILLSQHTRNTYPRPEGLRDIHIMLHGGTRYLSFITPSYLQRLASLEKKHGNRPMKATSLGDSHPKVEVVRVVMEGSGTGLRWGTRASPTSTTCEYHAARSSQPLHRQSPKSIP